MLNNLNSRLISKGRNEKCDLKMHTTQWADAASFSNYYAESSLLGNELWKKLCPFRDIDLNYDLHTFIVLWAIVCNATFKVKNNDLLQSRSSLKQL